MSLKNYTREEFLQGITQATIASFAFIPFVTGKAPDKKTHTTESAKLPVPDDAIILFQGDSITDAGRNKNEELSNDASALGSGYAFLAAVDLLGSHPSKKLQCYNRGISGNKVFQLSERWETDCLNLKPDILSILVGVNDFWHTLDFNYKGTAETYEDDYRKLMERTKKALPDTKIIIGEPFALRAGSAVNDSWYPNFPKYQDAAKAVAKDFGAAFIPFQSIFDAASEKVPATYWSADGVHPTLAGSHLMAKAWLETVSRL